jgi:hypothetical protein
MARITLNAGLKHLRGQVDGWVYKHYKYGTVVTRKPDMSRVKASAKQLAHREKIRQAAEFHRHTVLPNAALLAKFTARAGRKGIPVSAVSMSEYLKAARRKRPADATPPARSTAVRPRYAAAFTPEPELSRFIAEHPSLRKAYEKLSKRALVQIVMRAEMTAAKQAS